MIKYSINETKVFIQQNDDRVNGQYPDLSFECTSDNYWSCDAEYKTLGGVKRGIRALLKSEPEIQYVVAFATKSSGGERDIYLFNYSYPND